MMHGLRQSSGLIIWLFLTTLTLLGCVATGKRLEPPRVTLTHIQVQEIKVFETVFQVELRAFNTNDVAIEIKGLDCEFELNDRHFASGVSNKKIRVPPYDTATIPVDLYSSVLDLVQGLLDSSKKEKMKYKLKGRLHLGGDAATSVLPFESEGELSLPEPMSTTVGKTSKAENLP